MAAKTYLVMNSPMVTTSPPSKPATGTSTKTLLQLAPTAPVRVIEWGISLDGSSAATPGQVELIDTGTVFATVTAFAVADVQPSNDPNAPANTSGSSGTPLGLGTALSGYTASAEGSVTATRMLDLQQVAPTNQYVKQFPLGREPEVPAGHALRVRVTFGTSVNAWCYVVFEV
jgi:hypothetical protein